MSTNGKLITALVVVLLVAAGAAGVLLWSPSNGYVVNAANVPAGSPDHLFPTPYPFPDFTLVAPLGPDGKPVDLTPYRGKVLLVNLWATWCAPCIRELPSLAKLQATMGGPDFSVVTIALDEPDPAKVAPFLAQHGPGLPALIDVNRTIDQVMAVSALPTSLLVDDVGKVRAILTGDADWNCGRALEAVRAFIANNRISAEKLGACK